MHTILNPSATCVPQGRPLKSVRKIIKEEYCGFDTNNLGELETFLCSCGDFLVNTNNEIVRQNAEVWADKWEKHEEWYRSQAQEIIDKTFSDLKENPESKTLKFMDIPCLEMGIKEKSNLAYDIISMWNTHDRQDSHIIIGISSSKDYQDRLKGLPIDEQEKLTDLFFQELFNETAPRLTKRPEFQFVKTCHRDLHFGVIIVYNSEGKLAAFRPGSSSILHRMGTENVRTDIKSDAQYKWFGSIHSSGNQSKINSQTQPKVHKANSGAVEAMPRGQNVKIPISCEQKRIQDENMKTFDVKMGSFISKYKYCLITNCSNNESDDLLGVLGRIKWFKVFDFDLESRSGRGGVLSECEEVVKESQTLVITTWKNKERLTEGEDSLDVMKMESNSKNENQLEWFFPRGNMNSREALIKGGVKEWYKKTKDAIEQRCEDINNCYGSFPVFVLVLWYCTEPCASYLKKLLKKLECIVETVVLCHDESLVDEDKTEIAKWIEEDELADFEFSVIDGLPLSSICTHLADKFKSQSQSSSGNYTLPSSQVADVSISVEDFQVLDACLEVLYSQIPYTDTEEDATRTKLDRFFRGSSLPWNVIRYHQYDVQRDKQHMIVSHITQCISENEKVLLEILHRPGSGGSTLAKRVLWEISQTKKAVCVELKVRTLAMYQITESIVKLWRLTDLPIVALIDSDVANPKPKELLNSVHGARVIILHVKRYTGRRDVKMKEKIKQGKFLLEGEVSVQEAEQIANKLLEHGEDMSKQRKKGLRKLVEEVKQKTSHRLYEFGLTAYGEKYEGLTNYVAGNFKYMREEGLNWWQCIVAYLALVYYYGNVSIPAYLFCHLKLLDKKRVGENGTFYDHLPAGAQEFIVIDNASEFEKWKITYHEVAKEILEQVLHKPPLQRSQNPSLTVEARNKLADFVCKFIEDISCVKNYKTHVVSLDIMNIVFKTVIHREDMDNQNTIAKKKMSDLITDIPDFQPQTEKLKVLRKLTDCFKTDASVWAQRGRYTAMFSHSQDDNIWARKFFQKAVSLRQEQIENSGNDWDNMFSQIYHMYGQFLKEIVKSLFHDKKFEVDDMKPDGAFHKTMDEAVSIAQEAVEKFVNSRKYKPPGFEDTYGYVGEIQVHLSVMEAIKTHYKPNGLPGYLAIDFSPRNVRFVRYCLAECDTLIWECQETVHAGKVDEKFWNVDNRYREILHGAEAALACWKGDVNSPQNCRSRIAFIKRKGNKTGRHSVDDVGEEDLEVICHLLEFNLNHPDEDKQHADMDMVEWLQVIRHKLFPEDKSVEKVLLEVKKLADRFRSSRAGARAKFYQFILYVMLGLGIRHKSGKISQAQPGYLDQAYNLKESLRETQQLYKYLRQKREWLGKGNDENTIGIKTLVMDKTLPRQNKSDYYSEVEVKKYLQIRSGIIDTINTTRTSGYIDIDDGWTGSGGLGKPKQLKAYFVTKYAKGNLLIGNRVEFHVVFDTTHFIQAFNVEESLQIKCARCSKEHYHSSLSFEDQKVLWCSKCEIPLRYPKVGLS